MRSKSAKFIVVVALSVFIGLSGACSRDSAYNETAKAATSPPSSESPEMQTALKLVEKIPDSPSGYMQVAIIHIREARRTGDFSLNSKAETAINRALEIAPQDLSSRKLRASLLLTFHKFSEALEYGKKLDAEIPNDSFIQGVLTDANFELGNYDEAVAAAQKMVDLKPNSTSYARVAHLRSLHGDHDGSVAMYRTAAKTTDSMDAEAQSWCLVQLGDEYFKYGKFAEAEKVYDEALSTLPGFYLALAAKGKIRAAQNDYDGAEKILTTLLNRVPNVDSTVLLGDIYMKKGDAVNAKAQYDLAEVMEQKVGLNNDQKRLALMWADQGIRLGDALEIVEREHAASKDIYTEDALAWTLFKNGKLKEAKASITRALRVKSNDARMLYHAGMIEKGLGNRAEAVKLIQSALKFNPSFDIIQSEVAKQALIELKGRA